MTAKRKRLDALEARATARASSAPQSDALAATARRVCQALPEDLQATVTERGARGYADLLEAWWEVDGGEDLALSARTAYGLAFAGAR